jgi:hypothetical protein
MTALRPALAVRCESRSRRATGQHSPTSSPADTTQSPPMPRTEQRVGQSCPRPSRLRHQIRPERGSRRGRRCRSPARRCRRHSSTSTTTAPSCEPPRRGPARSHVGDDRSQRRCGVNPRGRPVDGELVNLALLLLAAIAVLAGLLRLAGTVAAWLGGAQQPSRGLEGGFRVLAAPHDPADALGTSGLPAVIYWLGLAIMVTSSRGVDGLGGAAQPGRVGNLRRRSVLVARIRRDEGVQAE